MNPFQKKQGSPPALTAPGSKPVEQPIPAQPEQPATEPGKVVISPEMVNFRTADEVCRTCDHWGQDGQCSVLNMATEANDSCNAYAEREDGASDIEPVGAEAAEGELDAA